MDPIEVWRLDATGELFLVGDAGATVFGPVAPHEALRQHRLAVEPHEDVLRIPCFHEVFDTRPNPLAASAYTKVELAWLPPSVSVDELPEDLHAFIAWQPPVDAGLAGEALRAVVAAGFAVDGRRAAFGRLSARYRVHPKGTSVVCERTEPRARCWFVEWADPISERAPRAR